MAAAVGWSRCAWQREFLRQAAAGSSPSWMLIRFRVSMWGGAKILPPYLQPGLTLSQAPRSRLETSFLSPRNRLATAARAHPSCYLIISVNACRSSPALKTSDHSNLRKCLRTVVETGCLASQPSYLTLANCRDVVRHRILHDDVAIKARQTAETKSLVPEPKSLDSIPWQWQRESQE